KEVKLTFIHELHVFDSSQEYISSPNFTKGGTLEAQISQKYTKVLDFCKKVWYNIRQIQRTI
ncbi:MAG: hypothetical protein VW715_16455, partial [Rhodospirillales bacterium]